MNQVIKPGPSEVTPDNPNVIFGHKVCQTSESKWLCIEELYQKFNRPNFYDIGGTYIADVADFWFVYKTEQVADIYLFHLFLWNRHEGSFTIGVSDSNDIEFDKKNETVCLSTSLKELTYKKVKEISKHYIITYSFKEIDVDLFKNKKVYIALSFLRRETEKLSQEIIQNVKCNHDFSALLKDPVGSNFTIEVSDGHKFKVHKALLAASSEVFKAMLRDDMAESKSGYVKLIDVTKEDFQCVLECIYSGTVYDLGNSNPFVLLQLADRFNLRGLLDLCQYILSQHMTIQNVLETLIIADMYNANVLKHAAMRLIKSNKYIIRTSMFKELNNADLARELCEYLVPAL